VIEELKKRFGNLFEKNLLGIFGCILGGMAGAKLIDIGVFYGF
jgi:hypothetical protein